MPTALKPLEILFYTFWHTHRYRQDLANTLDNCYFSLTKATPKKNVKIWKTPLVDMWDILIKVCIHIQDPDKCRFSLTEVEM